LKESADERPTGEVTEWLLRWSDGDRDALQRLMPLVYRELRRQASFQLRRERGDHTLETAALVHEAFLRLVDQQRCRWQSRAQFFAIAARMMRRILVDHARRRSYLKRGSPALRLVVDDMDQIPARSPHDWLALDEALARLAAQEPTQSQVVEMHFFGGLTHEEIAAVIGVSVPTVVRKWRLARAWLYRDLKEDRRGS
jgi:RNA polymerase sigma-70 factor (ECF subfamily)